MCSISEGDCFQFTLNSLLIFGVNRFHWDFIQFEAKMTEGTIQEKLQIYLCEAFLASQEVL